MILSSFTPADFRPAMTALTISGRVETPLPKRQLILIPTTSFGENNFFQPSTPVLDLVSFATPLAIIFSTTGCTTALSAVSEEASVAMTTRVLPDVLAVAVAAFTIPGKLSAAPVSAIFLKNSLRVVLSPIASPFDSSCKSIPSYSLSHFCCLQAHWPKQPHQNLWKLANASGG